MDFHAHLSSHEVCRHSYLRSIAPFHHCTAPTDRPPRPHLAPQIIGLLGGTWDPVARRLVVREAFPCRRALGSEASTSVELDASSEVEVRAQMEGEGLVPVGWYHSHPTFAPNPSIKVSGA